MYRGERKEKEIRTMKNYMIIRAYTDQTCATEHGNDICKIMYACAIYLEDPDCCFLQVIDVETDNIIIDISR